jgi:SAM-dependent methyltransferase
MKKDNPDEAIRRQYEQYGVEAYYERYGGDYRNPHEPIVRRLVEESVQRWRLDLTRVLDLACGSGEATLALREFGAGVIDGVDPYTAHAYRARTGAEAEALSFEQIAAGALGGRRYSLVVCSFAMHLIQTSWLPPLLMELAQLAPRMLILTPHKRPEIKPGWGWDLEDEILLDRVRARVYKKV